MKAAFCALIAATVLCSVARADALDRRLNEEMPSIKKHLDAKGYKTVGVLRFGVQKGKDPVKYDNAPFNGNLVVRLENLLIIHGGPDESKALAVLRDVGKTAAKAGVGDWTSDEKERAKLCEVSYPIAWGEKLAKADVFLTGVIRITEDLKKTTLVIRCFARDDLALKDVAEFSFPTDRDSLRDLGYSFVFPRKVRESLVTQRQAHTAEAINTYSLDAVREKAKEPDPTDVAGVEVTPLVEDKPTTFKPAPADSDGPRWQLPCPEEGKAIAFRFRNTTTKPIAVVVKVNGVSTFEEQTAPAEGCRKWVIKPGKTWTVRGFYKPEGEKLTYAPFKVLVGDEAKTAKATLGDKAGLIEIDVFAEGAEQEEVSVSLRGLPPSKEKEDRSSYKAVRTALLQSANLKTEVKDVKSDKEVVKREVIVPDKTTVEHKGKLGTVDFESHFVGHLAIQITPR